ncbi:MAG: hypothetical protein WBQ60_12535 [Asticcacaulis sp.]
MSLVLSGGAIMAPQASAAQLMPDLSAHGFTNRAVLRDGDFNGDGRLDELYFVTENDTGRIALHVRLNLPQGDKDMRVTSFDSSRTPDLQLAHAGYYRMDCGTYSDDCSQKGITTTQDSLIMGMSGGVNVLLHWQDDHFEQDFVKSDEVAMTRALSVLYAVNR